MVLRLVNVPSQRDGALFTEDFFFIATTEPRGLSARVVIDLPTESKQ